MSGFCRKPLLCLDLQYFISAGGRLVLAKAFIHAIIDFNGVHETASLGWSFCLSKGQKKTSNPFNLVKRSNHETGNQYSYGGSLTYNTLEDIQLNYLRSGDRGMTTMFCRISRTWGLIFILF